MAKVLKVTGPFSLLNWFRVKFSVLDVQLNSALQRNNLHPWTDWKRMFWHEFLISFPWVKFVFSCTAHQFHYSQFILEKVKEEICPLNSVLIFILYWQITCKNLDIIELPLPLISQVLLVALFCRSRFDFFQHKSTTLKFKERWKSPQKQFLVVLLWCWVPTEVWEHIFILASQLYISLELRKIAGFH